jgi:hypothetical protein
MRIPNLQVTLWLAIVVAGTAMVFHALGQPHEATLAVIVVSCCLLVLDCLLGPEDE